MGVSLRRSSSLTGLLHYWLLLNRAFKRERLANATPQLAEVGTFVPESFESCEHRADRLCLNRP